MMESPQSIPHTKSETEKPRNSAFTYLMKILRVNENIHTANSLFSSFIHISKTSISLSIACVSNTNLTHLNYPFFIFKTEDFLYQSF